MVLERTLNFCGQTYVGPIAPPGYGDYTSISLGPDDGTMNKMARQFWKPMRHGSTQEMSANFVSRVHTDGARAIHIVGHGTSGEMEVGCGQNKFDILKYLMVDTEPAWRANWAALGSNGVIEINLWGCSVGRTEAGLKLLNRISDITGLVARAPDNVIMVNDNAVWLGAGTMWVESRPTHRPPPLQSIKPPPIFQNPVLPPRPRIENFDREEVKLQNGMSFFFEEIIEIEIKKRQNIFEMKGRDAQIFMLEVLHADEIKFPGTPAAIRTGDLYIKLNNEIGSLTYGIYADTILMNVQGFGFFVD